jgi:hypothetical protein
MQRARGLATWLCAAAVAWMQMCAPGLPVLADGASTPIVAVGETGAQTNSPDAASALRASLERELARLPSLRVAATREARYVVRGSVTRLERTPAGRDVQVRCEVSLVVAEARGGSIRFMLSGRAGARGPDAATLERAALDAAVRGALRPLSSTLVALR